MFKYFESDNEKIILFKHLSRYPPKVMDLIEELSKGLADDLREKRKGKLQRTFVSASDAAEAKAKGTV